MDIFVSTIETITRKLLELECEIQIELADLYSDEHFKHFFNFLATRRTHSNQRITSFTGVPEMDRQRLFSLFTNDKVFFETFPIEQRLNRTVSAVSRLLQP